MNDNSLRTLEESCCYLRDSLRRYLPEETLKRFNGGIFDVVDENTSREILRRERNFKQRFLQTKASFYSVMLKFFEGEESAGRYWDFSRETPLEERGEFEN